MRTISRHSHFYDLLDALARPGCALCTLAAGARWRYLDSLAYENVNDPGVREKLRAALGFCNRHAWYFVERVRDVFGAAIIYRDVLHAVQRRAADGPSPDPFSPSGPCVACVAERITVDGAIETLADAIQEPDLRAAFLESEGLCAPHLRRVLTLTHGTTRSDLLDLTSEVWEDVAADARRLRWRAAGAAVTFGTDELALYELGSNRARAALPADEPFVCAVCTAVRADLEGMTTWSELDRGDAGICNVHAWMTAGKDTLEIYRRQIEATRERAEALPPSTDSLVSQAIRSLGLTRPPTDMPLLPLRCVVCAHQAQVETRLCAEARGPLCLPHLRRALRLREADVVNQVRPTWNELDGLLGEYLRKEDYRFRSEPRGTEQESPRWVVALIAGQPGIR